MRIEERLARLRGRNGDPKQEELKRILSLPIAEPLSEEEHEAWEKICVKPRSYAKGWRLFPSQADATFAIAQYQGVLAPIKVGGGKTLTGLLGAALLSQYHLHEKMVLCLPSKTFYQLQLKELPKYREHFELYDLPVHLLGGDCTPQARARLAQSGLKGLYVVPYATLSSPSDVCPGYKILPWIKPTAFILDEAHNVRDLRSARTGRLSDYIDSCDVPPVVVAMSGTMLAKTLLDFHHISTWSLRDRSPLPISHSRCVDWACVLDPQASPSRRQRTFFLPLLEWAGSSDLSQRGLRQAFRKRLKSTPGVVSASEDDLGTSLVFQNNPASTDNPDFPKLMEMVRMVEKDGLTPNGDELEDKFGGHRWLKELSAGFYNELVWPELEQIGENAEERLDRSKVHHESLQKYHKGLRKWISYNRTPGLDTAFLVGSELYHHGAKRVGAELHTLWSDARALDFDGRVHRVGYPVRVCNYKVIHAVEWLSSVDDEGIIWVESPEIGRWIHELAPHTIFCDASPYGHKEIQKEEHKAIIATIGAHGEGKNLQHHQNQLVLQWPRGAPIAEQLIGRLHRPGQKADELIVHTADTTEFDQMTRAACLLDSLGLHQLEDPKKVITGTYANKLEDFPREVLLEKGFQF